MAAEIKTLVKQAIAQGWRVRKLKSGHWMFLSPNTAVAPIVFSGTPSDYRAILNFKAALKRSGFKFDGLGWAGGLVSSFFGG